MSNPSEVVSVDVLKILEQLGIDTFKSQLQCGIPSQDYPLVIVTPKEPS